MDAVLNGGFHPNVDRRLLVAVACSLALHLGLLYALSELFDPERKATPEPAKLTARLVEPKVQLPRVVAEAPEPVPTQPPPKVARPAPQEGVRGNLGTPVPMKPAPRVREVAPPVIAVPPTPAPPPVALAPAPESQPAAPPVAAAPPAAATQGDAAALAAPDPGSIAQFRLELIELAKRHKRYPRAAVDNNWEGKVDLRMVIAANGSIASLSVRKSAGFAPLDAEAQQMFRTAKGQLPVPPALRGREFTVDVSADFYFLKE